MAYDLYFNAVTASAPIQYWRLDETSGTTAANWATASNSATLPASWSFVTAASSGNSPTTSSAFNYWTGEISCLSCSVHPTETTLPSMTLPCNIDNVIKEHVQWTIEFWWQPPPPALWSSLTYLNIMGKTEKTATYWRGFSVFYQNNIGLVVYFTFPTGSNLYSQAYNNSYGTLLAFPGWRHFVFVHRPTGSYTNSLRDFDIYIDGEATTFSWAGYTFSGSASFANTGTLKLGNSDFITTEGGGGQQYRDVAIYNRALTAYEVREHFAVGRRYLSGTTSGSLTMESGTLPTGSHANIIQGNAFAVKNYTFVSASESSGSRGNPSKLNPGVN